MSTLLTSLLREEQICFDRIVIFLNVEDSYWIISFFWPSKIYILISIMFNISLYSDNIVRWRHHLKLNIPIPSFFVSIIPTQTFLHEYKRIMSQMSSNGSSFLSLLSPLRFACFSLQKNKYLLPLPGCEPSTSEWVGRY